MAWREILKESSPKLRQENVVRTVEGANPKPEKDDERCKKKLQEIIDGVFRLLQGKEYFAMYAPAHNVASSPASSPPQIGDSITEEDACNLLESMQEAKNNRGFFWNKGGSSLAVSFMTGTEGRDGKAWGKEWNEERNFYNYIRNILENEGFYDTVNSLFTCRFHMLSYSPRPNETGEDFVSRLDNGHFSFAVRMTNFAKLAYNATTVAEETENNLWFKKLHLDSIMEEWNEIHDGILGLL
tara:strand:- start:675 stop:1397 length:723 start_codon:yes stop_codon:yes gene_type:complete